MAEVKRALKSLKNGKASGYDNIPLRPRLITLASTLIIPDITKTSANYCLKLNTN